MKLSFTDTSGKVIRELHAAAEADERGRSATPGARWRKAGKLHPGMNRFQWNLRYPKAVDVKGIFHSGFRPPSRSGRKWCPAPTTSKLTYGGATQKQPFEVKLDPRLHTTQAELQQRFDLLMRIQTRSTSWTPT